MAPVPPPTNKLVQVGTVVVRTRSLLTPPLPNHTYNGCNWDCTGIEMQVQCPLQMLSTFTSYQPKENVSVQLCVHPLFIFFCIQTFTCTCTHGTKPLYAIQEITALILQSYNTTQQPLSPFICYMSLDSVSSGVHILTPHGMIPSCYF